MKFQVCEWEDLEKSRISTRRMIRRFSNFPPQRCTCGSEKCAGVTVAASGVTPIWIFRWDVKSLSEFYGHCVKMNSTLLNQCDILIHDSQRDQNSKNYAIIVCHLELPSRKALNRNFYQFKNLLSLWPGISNGRDHFYPDMLRIFHGEFCIRFF